MKQIEMSVLKFIWINLSFPLVSKYCLVAMPFSWLFHVTSISRTQVERLLVDHRQAWVVEKQMNSFILKSGASSYFTWDIWGIIMSVLPHYLCSTDSKY